MSVMRFGSGDNPGIVVRELRGEQDLVQELVGGNASAGASGAATVAVIYIVRLPCLTHRTARVIRRLNDVCRDRKIILILSQANDNEVIAGYAAGADDVLIEPVNEALLEIKVRLQKEVLLNSVRRSRDSASLLRSVVKLQDLAFHDPVLGISNRRTFERALKREWSRHRRTKQPLALIFCDIDHFKAYNDTYGHRLGDAALYRVARCLDSELHRETDVVCRYGGEEFVVLLSNTDAMGGNVIARRLRAAVARLGIEHRKSPVADFLTLSFGIASIVPNSAASAEDLVELADSALYRAKEVGRNTVIAYDRNAVSVQKIPSFRDGRTENETI